MRGLLRRLTLRRRQQVWTGSTCWCCGVQWPEPRPVHARVVFCDGICRMADRRGITRQEMELAWGESSAEPIDLSAYDERRVQA